MCEKNDNLGTIEASERLIKDLYIDLQLKIREWANLTNQTSQARMGYIGQHLVSVVTGYLGSKSGARGHDLLLPDNKFAEIKTCYRVDQMGKCKNCKNSILRSETICPNCGSNDIERKNDSKWIITIKHDNALNNLIDNELYYFVLFEYEDYKDDDNQDIIASIWTVDPKNYGFALCMLDYYYNTRKDASSAPYNMWPHSLKFYLCNPKLIYRSIIHNDGLIETVVFPTLENEECLKKDDFVKCYKARTITKKNLKNAINSVTTGIAISQMNKKQLFQTFVDNCTSIEQICSVLSKEIYLPLLRSHKDSISEKYKKYFED